MILAFMSFGFGFKKLVEQGNSGRKKNPVVTDNEKRKKRWRTDTRGGVQ
jgi:hypothetical protein